MRRILIALLAAAYFHVAAQTVGSARDPLNYPLKHYAFILFMSLAGGFVGWYAKVRKGEISGVSLFALIGEMATSALAGMMAFLVCDHFDVPLGMTGAITGLVGYMGGRAIELGEKALQDRINRRVQP
jgi:hypothetical protein